MNNDDQLLKICKILGTEDLHKYLNKYKIELPERYKPILKKYLTYYYPPIVSLKKI